MTVTTLSLDAQAAPAGRAAGRRRARVDGLLAAYGLAWAAGAIHFKVGLEHFGEQQSHGVFFALLGSAQLLWGIAVRRSPTRALLLTGAIMSLAVVALWIVSRTSGIPVGPSAWRPEPVGALDSIASADEVVLALLVGLRLRAGSAPERASRYLPALGLCLIVVSSLSLTQLGHSH